MTSPDKTSLKDGDPSLLADSLAGLTPEQRALLMLRMRRRSGQGLEGEPVLGPVPRDRELPLSFAQQRLWFLDQWQPRNPAWNIFAASRLAGRLDFAALRQAFNEIVRRHESLRTSFLVADGQPVQVVVPLAPLPTPLIDLSGVPEGGREAEVRRLIEEEALRPFDLSGDRLVRVALVRCATEEHVSLMTMHHIVSDGWSIAVFIREFAALYAAFSARRPSPLPELPVQYPDFAVWQREQLSGARLEEQLGAWRRALEGAPPATELPVTRPWPVVRTGEGAEEPFSIPAELASGLRALALREGTTLFMALLAAFDTLLHRYSGAEDLLVGTPVAGRDRAELEGMIGFFVNTLVLRADLAGNPSFRELLARTRETALAAQAHQEVPFEKLVEELRPERDPLRPPLVQVVFSFQNTPYAALDLAGVELTPLDSPRRSARYDLLLSMTDWEGDLPGSLEYSTDLFDAPAARRILGHFAALVAGIVADPERRLADLPLLTREEQRQIAVASVPRPSFASELPLHRLFERAAARNPAAVAISLDGHGTTYGELDARASLLARHLRELGVGPEVLVGLFAERSPELIAGLLGILKAGGAYVPLDPDLPTERLAFLLEDSGVRVVVVGPGLEGRLPRVDGLVVVEIADPGSEEAERVDGGAAPDNAAYVIYTSGSTGRPKGVVVRHAEVARLFAATEAWFGFGPEDVWTLFHSYSFDFSVWEIWGALAHGGRLVIVPFAVSRSPEAFHALLARERVTVLNQTPSAFRQLVQWEREQPTAAALALREVIFGGEALELPVLAPWFERHGDELPRLVNMYGITETTVHVTFREIRRSDLETASGSVIGVPIPDLGVWLLDGLDGEGRPVPDLVPGEIHVGGAGLARGYFGRPELTAERFVPDPFSQVPGGRLYRSGDLARRLPGGDLQYLGRSDDQIKIRGFRIEPGEIEAALATHPSIAEAAVLVRGGSQEGKRLVAWVVPRPGTAPSPADLRRFAAERLPEHMVPARFALLDALPLTANGKLDRRALAALAALAAKTAVEVSAGEDVATEEYEPPASPAERILAEVWSEALGVERVGAHDGFFALGGDSILSLRVLARARERGLEISLQQLFQHPTLRALACQVETVAAGEADGGPFSLVDPEDRAALPAGLVDAYPLARLQSGMLFHTELRPETAVYHDVFSAWVRAPFDAARLSAEILRAAARHPVLRTGFALTGYREPLQLVHAAVQVPFAVDDLRPLPEAERERTVRAWLEAERHRGFAWDRPPLVRFQVHRRTDDSFQLTLSFHHSVLDGWSAASLLAGLFRSYLDLPGGPGEAPPPGVFREYVRLERCALSSDEARAVWGELLAGAEPCMVPRWPVGSSPQRESDSRDLAVSIPAATAEGLRAVARSVGAPLKSALLAAHVAVLARWTGRSDLLTGMVTNGRPEVAGGDRALGLYLNTLPLRVRLGAESWAELTASLFALETRLLPHRRFPLSDLQALAGQGALFDALFNFVHFHVYQGLRGVPDVEVLGWEGYEETDTALGASFQVDPDGGQLDLRLSYLTGAVDARQAEALAGSYVRALAALAADPAARAAEVPLLSAGELHQVLAEWAEGRLPDPDCHIPLHRIFARRAAAAPERIALVDAMGAAMTYGEVEAWTNRMAGWLRSLGVGSETLVGVALEPSLERICLFVAILKAGGAYVPLDLAYPRERLALMVEEARLPLIVAESRRAAELAFAGVRTLSLAAEREAIVRQSPLPPPEVPCGLAFVMFTSGSTGRPKAVGVGHRGVNRLALGQDGPGEVYLQLSPVSFDASTQEIWGALLNGGRLVLMPPGVPSLEELERALVRHGVTVLVIPPSLFHQIAALRPEMLRTVTFVAVGGDVLVPEAAARSLEASPGCVVSNGYGPTENTTYTATYEMFVPPAIDTPLPIGRPIPGTRVHVVDEAFLPVPAGVPGELVTGGDGLARGYLNRPDWTATSFVPDPFSGEPGARLYRTGDRAAWGLDGLLRFLGRLDQQVKIRGFRIEPAEVEGHLSAHPEVAEGVVVVRDDLPGGRGLAAFLVARGAVDPAGVRAFLAERVPPYMIPAAFELLPELPLTPVGKVDRRALAQLDLRLERPLEESAAPRDPVEQTLAAVWREVLGLEWIGRHDDFFALGGSSLVAIQAVSRLRAVFGIEVPLRWLFDAPTIAELSGRVAGLLRAETGPPAPPLVPRPAGVEELPLSFAQERLWFVEQLQPGTAAYNMATVARLTGALDAAALARSVDALAARHESLRTRFPASYSGAPVQVIDAPRAGLLPLVDFTALPEPRREQAARAVAEIEALRPFELEAGPLFRAVLLRVDAGDHLALLAMHHIVSDGWSMGILIREMTALYAAGGSIRSAELSGLPVQYADFSLWQRGWLQGAVLEERFRFWRERLAGAPAVLALPLDRPRPPVQTFRGDHRDLHYDPALLEGLEALARRGGATLFMVLLAAFDALLARLTGERDLVIGVPSANRDRPEIEGLIGFFVNSLPVRVEVDPEAGFLRLAERVREASLAAFAHADVPFEKLVAELRPERALSHTPIFQVLFQLLDLPEAPGVELPGLSLRFPEVESHTAKFDLVVSFSRSGQSLAGEWRYGTDLFDGTTVQRFGRNFEVLLRGILDDPERPVADLPLLTAAERHQMSVEWNATAAELPAATVPELFARQAALTPEAVAVVCAGKRLTYGELARRVRRVARRLVARGVRPEKVVAVMAERGPDFLTALLAILKAGGVYLPLDPNHPPLRIAHILAQSGARWVIAEGHAAIGSGHMPETLGLADLLAEEGAGRAHQGLKPLATQKNRPSGATPPSMSGQTGWVGESPRRADFFSSQGFQPLVERRGLGKLGPMGPGGEGPGGAGPSPDHLAYVLFTSGSTGVPKGAMLTHRGMLNHLRAKIADLGLGPEDGVAQTAAPVFDISIWQHLGALLVGGRVHVFRDEVSRDPFRLLAAADRERITVLEIVPSLLAGLLQSLSELETRPALAGLRWLISTGEALPPDLARAWRREYPEAALLNAYGPTECTDRVSHGRLHDIPAGPMTPIGRPILNTRLHVLDERLRPVPAGVAGELCVAGAGVGRGYLGDPARTAEVFVADPGGEPGARLYRTGDLARFRADGTLEFIGRRDLQVKIRGVRIETGEIAAALADHPAVRRCAVLARPQADGTPALAAWLVTRRPIDPSDLRSFLRQRLPESMIPAVFVPLEALPLTPSGKLDRRALPDPFTGAPERAGEDAVAPRNPLEELIAGLWSEALGTASFGVHDDFFALGGDSIKGAILIHRLQRRLGEALSVATLFGAPSVARLAAHLEEHHPRAAARLLGREVADGAAPAEMVETGETVPAGRLAPVRRRRIPGPAPLSWSQERLWFLHQLDPGSAAYNMPLAFGVRGALDASALGRFDRALVEITRRHETLRTRFRVRDGRPEALVEPPPDRLLAVADLSALPVDRRAAEARLLVDAEALRPFDLEQGPVVRAFLVRSDQEEEGSAALFVSHHIACDGWSLGLWSHELSALFRGAELPEPPVQYSDFACWQRGWLDGEALEAQVGYWRGRLAGLPPYLDLPADRPRPPLQTFRGASASGLVPAGLADALRSLGRRQGASLFMVLLAGFQLLLQRQSGQDDVAVGAPIAGRPQPEVEGLIGCFLNTLVLRTDLSGRPTFEELLGRVRETALGAYAHQDVPFEKLLEELRPERDLSRPSLFQVLFNLLNAPAAHLDLPGLELAPLELPEAPAKFDMTLYLAEREEGLGLQLVWNADLFDPPRMEELLRQYRCLLEQIAERPGPGEVIDLYSLVTAEARPLLPDPREELGRRWPGAVHDLLARAAQQHPGRIALIDARSGPWTYGELDLAASRLAARLRADGIRPGDRVAIWAHRGGPLVWAVLGVLRAGAAFMILDPAYPDTRLVEILKLARPHGFLRLEAAGTLPPRLDSHIEQEPFLSLHQIPSGVAKIAVARFGAIPLPPAWPEAHPEDSAAVSFTSGSTGVPKGIVQTHGSMSHFIPWHQEVLGYSSEDRHTMLSGLAHDPLQRDIFYSLGTGATLCIPDPERIGEPGYLAGWMRREKVTVANLTPAMAWLLTELSPGSPPVELPDLRLAMLGGDVLTRRDVARLRRLAPRVRCVNVYGATESHRALSYHLVEEEGDGEERERQVLPLGRGKRDVQLLVLGRSGGIAGIGEMGEIAIRSPHLAEGYLKDAEQTAKRFVPNPFTHEPGDRIYLTGDLGRYLPDGEVAAAGRADRQIKIRGFRVEAGEVEAELGRIAGVREAVVVEREDAAGERRLVAYVVLDPAAPPPATELRDALRERLPAYMVPSVFVPLNRLPLNPNGKVDRRALPAPEEVLPALEEARRKVAPRDHLELRLTRIWEEVLAVSPVGVTDDFFELGGYSLLAASLMARVESDFGRTLPLAALFQRPTVEELAHLLRIGGGGEEPVLLGLQDSADGGGRPPLFLIHPAGGRALVYFDLARALGPAWPVWGLQDVAPPDAPRTLPGMAAEYLRHVRRVRPTGPYLLAGWSFGGRVAFEMARQLVAAGEEVAFVGMIDTGLAEPPGRGATDAELLVEQLAGELPPDAVELSREADPVAAVVARAQQAGLLPADYPVEDARHSLEIFKIHLEVARTNRPQPYPGRVTFFAAEEQPDLPEDRAHEPGHGWAGYAGALEIIPVPGDHVTLIRVPQYMEVLAARLRGALEKALTPVPQKR